MTGLCGVLGDPTACRDLDLDLDALGRGLAWSPGERVDVFEAADGAVRVVRASHPDGDPDGPVSVGPLTVWLWGNVFGVDGSNGYQPRPRAVSPAEFCARHHRDHGPASVGALNGDFFLLVSDADTGTVAFVTDRLGSRDVYFARPSPDTLVFSSRIGSFPDLLGDVRFDPGSLTEYFTHRRAFGTKTPLAGVELFQPGSVTTFDLETGALATERYWKPRYRPLDRPFAWFVDAFVDRFQTALAERLVPGKRHGLLLSGGSDSRLILAALPPDVDIGTYHLASWMSREARTAERIALAADVEFEVLRRDEAYLPRLLERAAPMNNYVQRFQQAHADGFIDRLRAENDVLLTNHFADVLYKGNNVPTRSVRAGPLGRVDLPLVRPVESVRAYRETLASPTPAFVTGPSVRSILAESIRATEGGVVHHGVQYESAQAAALYGRVFPATNGTDSFFRRSLHENAVHQIPLLDHRLLDLLLSMPVRYQVDHNLVDAAVARLSPALAAIPHPDSGVSLKRSVPVSEASALGHAVWRRGLSMEERPPRPGFAHFPWDAPDELIRHDSFVRDCIERNATVFDQVPSLDYDGALATYRAHLDGENHMRVLFALATFLEMPVTHRIVEAAY